MPRKILFIAVVVLLSSGLMAFAQEPRRVALGDWPEIRGPQRTGVSIETDLVDRWEMNGENFLWRAPYGGRSAPIVMGNRVYVQNGAGRNADLQERVMALDADTGAVVWEFRYNIYQSDVPPHRIAWASPAADPETGNIYALSGGAELVALTSEGELAWRRSFGEEFAAFTTHGGRTMSPLIDGDLVIVSAAVSNWGAHGNRAHRFIALDKRTGDVVYVSNPGGRPFDTAYAPPLIATINGMRLLIAGLGDGAVHAIKPQTGERVWSFMAAKRAINTGVVVQGNTVFMSHGDENLNTNVMGMIAAIDGTQTGNITQAIWDVKGPEFGHSSPVTDGQRIYQIDNGARLRAFDIETGRELWVEALGTMHKAPPVFADGKIYVGTETGRFYIIQPHADRAEVLSSVELPVSTNSCCGSEGTPEQIVAGAAVSRGRIFFVTSDAVYAIGSREPRSLTGWAVDEPAPTGDGAPAHIQVVPTELVLTPGQTVQFRARLFDGKGGFLREERAAWSLDGLQGSVDDGVFTLANDPVDQQGVVKAELGGLTGEARVRVIRNLPWTEDFESYQDGEVPRAWVNGVAGRFSVVTLDGRKVLHKPADNTLFKRIRAFIGPADWSDYTFEADVRAPMQRRQMADVGITAHRYSLVLRGTTQRLKLEPWEPETTRSVTVPFAWQPDQWYRLKLRAENLSDGAVRLRGKAWAVGEPEPAEWLIDKTDPLGNGHGAPGLFIDAEFGVYLDNLSITANE